MFMGAFSNVIFLGGFIHFLANYVIRRDKMSLENNEKKCFVVTPIGKDATTTRRATEGLIDAVIIPALCELGFEGDNITVAHRISESGSINRQIITRIVEDDIAIVNLTELNPNVMYELAVRHAVAKPLVIIAEHGTALPFDIIDQRTVFYTNDMLGVVQLKDELKKAVMEALMANEMDNPIIKIIKENSAIHNVQTVGSDVVELIMNRLDRIEYKTSRNYNVNSNIKLLDERIFTAEFESLDPENHDTQKLIDWIKNLLVESVRYKHIRFRFSNDSNGKFRVDFVLNSLDEANSFSYYIEKKSYDDNLYRILMKSISK